MLFASDRAKIRSLHGLRAVMSWWVALGHIALGLGLNLGFINHNKLAVDVFILLSGFVIAMLVERKAEPFPQYITRRAFRLFPLYLLVLTMSALTLHAQYDAWHGLVPNSTNARRLSLSATALQSPLFHFIVHIPLLQGLVPYAFGGGQAAYTFVAQAWSISLEWQFYFVAPFLIAALNARRWIIVIIPLIGLILLVPFFPGAFLGAKIVLFIAGIASVHALKAKDRPLWLGIIVSCAVAAVVRDGVSQLVPFAIWALVLLSASRPAHSWGHWPARLLSSRFAFHMGEISYSVYLIHILALFVAVRVCADLRGDYPMFQAAVVAMTVIITYVAAVISYHLLEKPCIKLGANIAARMGKATPLPA